MFTNITFKNALTLYLTIWMVWFMMQTYILVDFGIDLKTAAIDSLITHLIFGITSFIIFITLKYYQPSRENQFYLKLWAFILAIANSVIIYEVLNSLYANNSAYVNLLNQSLVLRFCYQVLMIAFVTLILWLGQNSSEQKYLEQRKQETEAIVKEAELYNLRQQLQPHFLFNSLNSISALAGSKPEEARKMIQQLSEFLRHTLRKDEQQLITLQEELYQLNLYLEIEKVRFGNRLNSKIILDENCSNLLLPVLVLQPLVENAIKFGLYDTLGEVDIVIQASCHEGKWLQIEISNPFDAQTHKQSSGTGFGLESIKRRLYLLYASNDLVRTEILENKFLVRINIPQI